MDTPLSPSATPSSRAFADHLDLMFGTRERAIKTPGSEQDHVEVWRCIDGAGRRYFRKRFLRSEQSGVDYRLWINREFKLLIELSSEDLRHVQQYRNITNLGSGEQQLETLDAGPTGDHWQQVPVARHGVRLPHLFMDCAHWFGLGRGLLVALDDVHGLGFVHVDLKGDNFCLPAQRESEASDGYPDQIRLQWNELKLIDFAFSVWEEHLPLDKNSPLPIGRSTFRYQSEQLLAALEAGRSPTPELGPTRGLDWRVDLYSLGFVLEQILRDVEKRCLPQDGNWGWTETRHSQARRLLANLQGWDQRWQQDRQPAPVQRPHRALIEPLDRLLGEDDLAESLAHHWKIVRDPNWRPQDPSVRTPPTVPALRRREQSEALPSSALSSVQRLKKIVSKTLSALIPQTEANRCRAAAEQGDANAQFNLGVRYANGRGVEQDNAEAVKWYLKAAAQGNAKAQANLGVMYQTGRGVKQDDAEAVNWYRQAAKQGYADAQANLGWMYQYGRGVQQDAAEAVKWYLKAAEQGNATAQYNLGVRYANGRGGLPKDEAEAVKWYHQAAEQGNATAQANLGVKYDTGRGVEQDDAEAVKWYRQAAAQGDATAQVNLGWMYANGRGVQQDDAEAVKWYRQAAKQRNAVAQANLGWMYENGRGVKQDDAEAVKWYLKAAAQGNARAQHNLGVMYRDGRGVKQDDAEKAVKWFRQAAAQGDAFGQNSLGVMYRDGRGVKQDDAEAVNWYRQAAKQGYAVAQANLGWMYANGRGVEQDDAEAVKWYRQAAKQGNADAQNNLRRLGR